MKKLLTNLPCLILLIILTAACQPTPPSSLQQPVTPQVEATTTPTAQPTNTASYPTSTPPPSLQVNETLPSASPTNDADTTLVNLPMPTQTPTASPENDHTQPMPNPTEPECRDEAAFFADVTIPDDTVIDPGAPFTKTWKIRNTGTCSWDTGYSLVFSSGDIMDGPLTNQLPIIPPGEIAEVSVDLVAPSRGGQRVGNWLFENSQGKRFGVGAGGHDFIWVQIIVNWPVSSSDQESSTSTPIGDPAPPSPSQTTCTATQDANVEQQIVSLINTARAAAGLPALAPSAVLNAAALDHSFDMACRDFVDHVGSNGSTWYDRASSRGYANSASARENIYVGNPAFGGTPDSAYNWWMNSQVHRENILSPVVSEVGIGYAYNPSSSYGGYFTVVFARP